MNFKSYYLELDTAARQKLAIALGTSVPYLSQLAHGHRVASRKMAQAMEQATDGKVTAIEMLIPVSAVHIAVQPKPPFVCLEGGPCTEICEKCVARFACGDSETLNGQQPDADPHQAPAPSAQNEERDPG